MDPIARDFVLGYELSVEKDSFAEANGLNPVFRDEQEMNLSAAMPTNKPIFVVGSPRSGTSILTWCLGQHPNILVLREFAWMGYFAVDR
jgi:sulfotransferase family protein